MEAARRILTASGVFAISATVDADWKWCIGFVRAVRPDKNMPAPPDACWRAKE